MLGKLEKVEVRSVWPDERQFSDWLGKADGLKLLGESIEMELELESPGREVPVGPYFADLVCRDTADNKRVVIENEFGKGDHDHLGKLLTYASVLKADVVIWIAETIGDEHRAALDWLNEHTDEGAEFFGFEIKVLKIGDSEAAPQFHAVARPNELVRDVAATGQKTDAQIFYHEYWTKLKKYMEVNGRVKMTKPLWQNWMNFAVGKMSFHVTASISIGKKYNRVEFYSGKKEADNYRMADYIKEQHGKSIEALGANGLNVVYSHTKGGAMMIYVRKEKVNVSDESNWNEQHEWFSETIDRFVSTFRPIVAEINPNDFRHDEGENAEDDDGEHDSP